MVCGEEPLVLLLGEHPGRDDPSAGGGLGDAEDLLQETLLRAWRAYDRFDESRASLHTWLHRIATNACLTALEQRSRHVTAFENADLVALERLLTDDAVRNTKRAGRPVAGRGVL